MYVAFPCNLCVTVPEYAPAAKRMVDVCTMTVLPNSCPLDLCKRRGTLQIFGIVPQRLDGHPCPVLPADCLVMPSRIVSFKVFAVLNQHRALEACEGGTGTGRASAGGAAVPPGQGICCNEEPELLRVPAASAGQSLPRQSRQPASKSRLHLRPLLQNGRLRRTCQFGRLWRLWSGFIGFLGPRRTGVGFEFHMRRLCSGSVGVLQTCRVFLS